MRVLLSEYKEIHDVFSFYLRGYTVRAFGSRVHGRHLKPYSDLDLVIMSETQVPLKIWARAKDAFSISDLPFRVDLLDWSELPENFRSIIASGSELVHSPANEGDRSAEC